MKIICDTNVWYLIKLKPEYKPKDELILTAANYFDWYASVRMDPSHNKHIKLLESYKSAKLNHSEKLIIDPFDFAAVNMVNYTILEHTTNSFQAAENCLNEMLIGVYNTKQIFNIRDKCSTAKKRFVNQIKKNNKVLYENCSKQDQPFESGRYKLVKDCVIEYIKNWIMTFPGFARETKENLDWSRLDIFLNNYYKFINNKPKSPKPNSMIDLLNFLYLIDQEYVYWSEEKEFLELVRQSFGDKLPIFIYPHGKMVKQIFS